jgi:hypothetical protein
MPIIKTQSIEIMPSEVSQSVTTTKLSIHERAEHEFVTITLQIIFIC